MENLAKQFEEEVKEKMFRANKECGYNPTRFNQMISRYGGVETAKRLINRAMQTNDISEGFKKLWRYGRLDLSMEDSVCKAEYSSLFSLEEVQYCKEILGR